MSYSPNNIRFRIVSSNALAQYKLDQAFDFNELVNNMNCSFSQESRETLLLNYELWFRFIVRLERILIKNQNATESLGTIVDHFILLGRDIVVEIEEVMQTHPDLFKSHAKFIVRKAFVPYIEFIFDTIKKCESDNMYIAFPKIVTAISGALHNMLFILQEMEDLKKCEDISHKDCSHFLSYTSESKDIQNTIESCPTFTRASLYKKVYNTSNFIVKNYTHDDVYKNCQSCIHSASQEGIKISKVEECIDPHYYS